MGHQQPLYLWFVLLGLVPILIHLLLRFRVRRVRWGPTYILERALERLKQEKRWLVWLLLASRVLVGVALGYAFARPFLQAHTDDATTGGAIHHVVLLDNSYSMAYTPGEITTDEEGRRLLTLLADRWPRGAPYSVYSLAGGIRPVAEKQSRGDGQGFREILSEVALRDGSVDLGEALETIHRRTGGQDTEVILVGDGQAANWSRQRGLEAAAHCSYLWIRPQAEPKVNLYLTHLALPGQVVLTGDLVRVNVRIQCSRNASEPVSGVCELALPGQGRQRKTATVLPGQFRDVAFDVRLHQPGLHYLKAELRLPDGLPWDNTITAAMEVCERITVGVFRSTEGRAFDRSFDYLDLAFPGADAGVVVVEGTDEDWQDLERFDAVLLDDPETIGGRRAAALLTYVRHGGGLIVGLGPHFRAEQLAQRDRPLLANAAFERRQMRPLSGTAFWSLDLSSFSAPVFAALDTHDADGPRGTKFYGYWSAAREEDGEPRTVLARLDNGAPWLLGRRLGFGRVLVMTSGLSGAWNSLPVRGAYVHMVHRLVAYTTGGRRAPMNVRRGEPILAYVPENTHTVMTGPLEAPASPETRPLAARVREGRPIAAYDGALAHNGLYELRTLGGGAPRKRFAAVYDDRQEGDVTCLDEEAARAIVDRFGWSVVRDEASLRTWIEERAGGRELYALVLAALAFLLFAESWLSWKVGS